ncbi:uncharacterized protein LOC133030191 [Cannabis sativa]|uniref:uncharacterized protein LOC133030191 n=1 Tax=Cannabis sativa TaxID=3483 RepID=UPI0029C9F629|nr:uncharacterized protein LOC133030191 [Cannabis sativa]
MAQYWNGRCPVTITESSDMFSLSFGCAGDKARVLLREPFHFQNHHIILHSPTPGQSVQSESLKFTPFWVQIYRLLFLSKTKGLAVALGNIIGEFVDVFEDSLNKGWGPFLRVRVKIDITKPLLRGRMITLQQPKDDFWVEFRYECLPEYCMECGRIGHPFDKCMIYLEKLDNGIEPDLEYRPTMKGSPLPISSYDRYRTDFSKGNAWPLLTRLAKNSFISVIPSLKNQAPPSPNPMFIGESSRSGVNSLASTNEILQHSVNNNTLHSDVPVVSDVPTTATSLIQHTSRPAASVNPATSIHAQTPHNKSLTNNVRVNTAVKLDSPASSKINESVVDLSGIFTPLTVMDLAPNAYATYPPTSRTWQPPKPTQLNIPLPTQSYIVSKPTPTASATPQSGKENL